MRQVSKDKNFTIAFNLWPKLKEMGAIDNLFITGKINVRFHGRAQIFVDQLISFLKAKLEVNKDVTQRKRT